MTSQSRHLAKSAALVLLVVLGFGLAVLILYLLGHLLILIFLAALLASALYHVDLFLERRLPPPAAVGLTYLGLLIVVGGAGYLIFSPLVRQSSQLVEELPALLSQARQWVDDTFGEQLLQTLGQQAGETVPDPATLIRVPLTVLEVLVNLAIVFVTSFLLLLERKALRRWSMRFVAPKDKETVLDLVDKGIDKLGSYVRGQLLLMTAVGIGTGLGMVLVGVPFALPMGVLAFFLEAVPNFGPILAGVPVVFLGLLESPTIGFILLGWLLGLQALENYLLTPLIQHNALNLSPLAVFLAVIAGLALFGVVGAIIAVPLVAVADVLLEEIVLPFRRRGMRRAAPEGEPEAEERRAA